MNDEVPYFQANKEEEDTDDINFLLYAKERFNISNEAYHELSMIYNKMPRSWKVKDRIKEINKNWTLKQTHGGTQGIQQSIKERLGVRSTNKKFPSQFSFHCVTTYTCKVVWRWN